MIDHYHREILDLENGHLTVITVSDFGICENGREGWGVDVISYNHPFQPGEWTHAEVFSDMLSALEYSNELELSFVTGRACTVQHVDHGSDED